MTTCKLYITDLDSLFKDAIIKCLADLTFDIEILEESEGVLNLSMTTQEKYINMMDIEIIAAKFQCALFGVLYNLNETIVELIDVIPENL